MHHKPQIDSKLPNTKTTIFSVMSQLASDYGALNLSQGFPGFSGDKQLVDLVSKAMQDGHNQYAPMAGIPALRETIAEKLHTLYNCHYNPDTEITVTAGATQAIYTAIAACIRPGDEVLIFTPAYDCYEPAVTLHGGVVKTVSLHAPDYTINWEIVKQQITPKTRMVILNTPHNPTGAILEEKDLKTLEKLLTNTNILLLSDEVYEHIIFDGRKHQSAARFPALAERAFIVASFGKTFHNTGWKIGYCAAPHYLMKEFQKVHQYNVFCVNRPLQHALATYMKNPETYLQLPEFYQKKRDIFLSGLKGSIFTWTPAKGTYFQLLDYSAITEEEDVAFAKRLTKTHKIASIPTSVFYTEKTSPKMLRFCFAKEDDTLRKATDILQQLGKER